MSQIVGVDYKLTHNHLFNDVPRAKSGLWPSTVPYLTSNISKWQTCSGSYFEVKYHFLKIFLIYEHWHFNKTIPGLRFWRDILATLLFCFINFIILAFIPCPQKIFMSDVRSTTVRTFKHQVNQKHFVLTKLFPGLTGSLSDGE